MLSYQAGYDEELKRCDKFLQALGVNAFIHSNSVSCKHTKLHHTLQQEIWTV